MEIQSTVLGNVAVQRTITQHEINAYAKFAKEHGVIHDGSADDHHNATFVLDYFLDKWKETITEQNLTIAWEKIRPHLKLYSPAAINWYAAAEQNPQLGNDLANYVASTSGRPGQLVKDGSDLHFQNLLTLFQEINGRGESATSQSIAHAQDRILRQAGKGTLHYVPQPRRTEPMSRAAKEDALENPNRKPGQLFSGDMVRTSDGGWRNKNAAEQAADRRGAEEAQESPSVIRGREQAAAEQEAEAMRGSTHSESDQLQKLFVYDRVNQQIDWSATRNARRVMQATFERRRSMR